MIRFSLLTTIFLLLTACANKPAQSEAPPKRRVVVTVATNEAPLGAAWQNPAPTQAPIATPTSAGLPIQTQTSTPPPRARVLPLTARIASVNEKLRFVVVDFTSSRQPLIDERLSVYRVGEKVAEIKISGPYRNTTVAADIVAGEVKYGDEVKPE